MTTTDIVLTLGVGLITGFSSGLIGLGGGILLTPMLRLILGTPQLLALATPLPVLFPTAISGSLAYHRERQADFKLSGYMLITAIPMTWIGATLTSEVSGKFLMLLTGVFILLIAITSLVRTYRKKKPEHGIPVATHHIKAMAIGAVGGFFAGLLAIGGGVIYIPAILHFFRRTMKSAQATSLLTVMLVAIPGSIKHSMLGNIDWELAALLACTTIPASYIGGRVALKLRNQTLERIFGYILLLFGVYFILSEL